MVRPLEIGPLVIDPPLLQAPMAGFTNYAFRQVVRKHGGVGLPATEMFSARGFMQIESHGAGRQPERLWGVLDEPRPLAAQIWDNNPAVMAEVGRRLARDFRVSVVDINFGCPVFEVTEKAHSGSYLLRYPDRVGQIVGAVAKACAPTPVTAKIRLGACRDSINACDVAQAVEDAGGAALTVHGRTAADMFRGSADWEEISRIKPYLYRIPLIGNGDIATPQDVVEAFRRYDIDGVMVGRAALNRPWLFRQAQAALRGEPIPPDPDLAQQRQMMTEHFDLLIGQFGPQKATVLMRKFACCYANGRPGARAFARTWARSRRLTNSMQRWSSIFHATMRRCLPSPFSLRERNRGWDPRGKGGRLLSTSAPVTIWIDRIGTVSSLFAHKLWELCFHRLVGLARGRDNRSWSANLFSATADVDFAPTKSQNKTCPHSPLPVPPFFQDLFDMKRRRFLQTAAAAALGVQIVPRHVLGGDGHTPPSEKLQLASIGVGGMGGSDIGSLSEGPIAMVAVCDVHQGNLEAAARRFPGAKTFADWRELLDRLDKQIEAVSVSTPDHMHAPVSMSAIRRGKHVYCQKPMTHSLHEARHVAAAAAKAKVVTQMGIQIHSSIEYRMATELIRGGAIGKVKEVHSWSDRPGWPQGQSRPKSENPVPKELNWDLWLGVAPQRPFVAGAYVPFTWRGILDFGCGALGDMGCHIIDPPYTALKLTSPNVVWTEGPGCTDDMHPAWEIIHYEFPGTEYTAGKTLHLTWYDGGHQPDVSHLPLGKDQHLPSNGSIFVGEDGTILLPHVGGPQLLPREKFLGYKRPKLAGHNHYVQWVNACLGKDRTSAPFDFAGPLTETVLLGVLAARFPGKKLQWNAADLKVANLPEANRYVRSSYRQGWDIKGF